MFPFSHLLSSASIAFLITRVITHRTKNASLILLSSIIAENDLIYSEIRWLIFLLMKFWKIPLLRWENSADFYSWIIHFTPNWTFLNFSRNKRKLLKRRKVFHREKKETLFRRKKYAIKNFGKLSVEKEISWRNFWIFSRMFACVVNCLCQRPFSNCALK